MTAKFKKNEIVIYWELADQQNYPAIIKEVLKSPNDPTSQFSYLLAVDYGDEINNERVLVDNTTIEKYITKFKVKN